jgi:hypothetical protein
MNRRRAGHPPTGINEGMMFVLKRKVGKGGSGGHELAWHGFLLKEMARPQSRQAL